MIVVASNLESSPLFIGVKFIYRCSTSIKREKEIWYNILILFYQKVLNLVQILCENFKMSFFD